MKKKLDGLAAFLVDGFYFFCLNKMTRIAPTIQQAGTQTIQQSIYLAHGNPCGLNAFLSNKLGTTGLTYQDLAFLLQTAMNHPDAIGALSSLQYAFFLYSEESNNDNNLLRFLNGLFIYAKTIWESGFENGNLIQIDGYTPVFTCYDANGVLLFDSSIFPYWNPATEIGPDTFKFTPVVVQDTQSLNNQTREIKFYELLSRPSFYPFILRNIGTQADLVNSSYMVNQMSFGESIMAVNSILTDPANTRVYNAFRFGFSTRTQTPGSGNPAYHVCYLQFLKDNQEITNNTYFNNLAHMFFVRLSIVRSS